MNNSTQLFQSPSATSQKKLCLFQEDAYLGLDPFAHWYDHEIEYSESLIPLSEDTPVLSEEEIQGILDFKHDANSYPTCATEIKLVQPFVNLTGNEVQTSKVSNLPELAKPEESKTPQDESCENVSSRENIYTPGEHSARPDVVCKTIVRGIKRYFCQLLCNGNPLIQTLTCDEGVEVLRKIDDYCDANFKPSSECTDDFETLSTSQLLNCKRYYKHSGLPVELQTYYRVKILLACMVLNIPLRKKFAIPYVKTAFNLFYNCIYKYSKKKLIKLLKFKPFAAIFEQFVSEGQMEKMLENDATFSSNQKVYRETFQDLLSIVRT